MPENLYHILGVDSDATLDEIKAAYRRIAKRLHPDHFAGGSGPFRAAHEAYEVLRDPDRRQTYDDELAHAQRVHRATPGTTPQPLRRRQPPVEPLVPSGRSTSPRDAPFEAPFISPFDALRGHPWAGERTEEIHLQVSLTQEQARQGGRVRFWIRLPQRCPTCRGQGGDRYFACMQCLGRGVVVAETPLEIAYPPRIEDGTTGRVALNRPGMADAVLILHFSVSLW